MLHAEITDADWVAIIGAVFLGVQQTLSVYLTWRGNQKIDANTKITQDVMPQTTAKVDSAVKAVQQVADDSKAETRKVATMVAAKVGKDTAEEVATKATEEIKTAVNGRMDQFIAEATARARAEAKAEGRAEGKEEGFREGYAQGRSDAEHSAKKT